MTYKYQYSLLESGHPSTFSPDDKDGLYFVPKPSASMSTIATRFESIFRSRLLRHFSFWIIILLVLAYHASLFGGSFKNNLINMAVMMPVQMMVAYSLIYWQIPKLLFKGKWLVFLTSMIISALLFSVVARLMIINIAEPIIGIDGVDESLREIISDPLYLIKVYLPSVYLPGIILFLLKMTRERFANENRMVILQKEKQTAELNFLKAQMNPHFLFNTLNNIYALSKSNSEQTPEMILKLSEILDYTIYECNANQVTINKEWELIEHYADLEALRHHEEISIVLEKDIDNPDSQIAPLILISLVENAFKHSMKGENKHPHIKIRLQVKNQRLVFNLTNTKDKRTRISGSKKGIGVENVRRQLALQYPDKHEMKIGSADNLYHVELIIQLK